MHQPHGTASASQTQPHSITVSAPQYQPHNRPLMRSLLWLLILKPLLLLLLKPYQPLSGPCPASLKKRDRFNYEIKCLGCFQLAPHPRQLMPTISSLKLSFAAADSRPQIHSFGASLTASASLKSLMHSLNRTASASLPQTFPKNCPSPQTPHVRFPERGWRRGAHCERLLGGSWGGAGVSLGTP